MTPVQHIQLKTSINLQVVTLFSIIIHIAISIKIFFYKRKIVPSIVVTDDSRELSKQASLKNIESNTLLDKTTSICIVLLFCTLGFMFWRANQIQMADFNCYPNYLVEYFNRLIWPSLFVAIIITLHYSRLPKLRSALQMELQDQLQSFRAWQSVTSGCCKK